MRVAIALAITLAACHRDAPPPEFPRHTPAMQHEINAATIRLDEAKSRPIPCRMILAAIDKGSAVPADRCDRRPTVGASLACAAAAFEARRPFLVCTGGWGMDSYVELAYAGTQSGNVDFYYLDTMGPYERGACLRRNVSIAPDRWPVCTRALTAKVNIRTGARVK